MKLYAVGLSEWVVLMPDTDPLVWVTEQIDPKRYTAFYRLNHRDISDRVPQGSVITMQLEQ